MPGRETEFGPERRLRRRGEFQRVFDHGQRIQGRYMVVLAAPGPWKGARLGIVASRKIGDAVRRNRAKRLIREIFRRNVIVAGDAVDVVVIPRRELFDAAYASLEADFRSAYRRSIARLGTRGRS